MAQKKIPKKKKSSKQVILLTLVGWLVWLVGLVGWFGWLVSNLTYYSVRRRSALAINWLAAIGWAGCLLLLWSSSD